MTLLLSWITLTQHGWIITCLAKCGIKFHIHCHSSRVTWITCFIPHSIMDVIAYPCLWIYQRMYMHYHWKYKDLASARYRKVLYFFFPHNLHKVLNTRLQAVWSISSSLKCFQIHGLPMTWNLTSQLVSLNWKSIGFTHAKITHPTTAMFSPKPLVF